MLEHVDGWFLQIAVLVLSGYFLWSIRNVLSDFKDQVKGLKETIGKLFDRHDDLDRRLSSLEGRCEATHFGRRATDRKIGDDAA